MSLSLPLQSEPNRAAVWWWTEWKRRKLLFFTLKRHRRQSPETRFVLHYYCQCYCCSARTWIKSNIFSISVEAPTSPESDSPSWARGIQPRTSLELTTPTDECEASDTTGQECLFVQKHRNTLMLKSNKTAHLWLHQNAGIHRRMAGLYELKFSKHWNQTSNISWNICFLDSYMSINDKVSSFAVNTYFITTG